MSETVATESTQQKPQIGALLLVFVVLVGITGFVAYRVWTPYTSESLKTYFEKHLMASQGGGCSATIPAQTLFKRIHPIGSVQRLKIIDVQPVWKGNGPSRFLKNLESADIALVMYWKSLINKNGETIIVGTYDPSLGWFTSYKLVQSNGVVTDEAANTVNSVTNKTVGALSNSVKKVLTDQRIETISDAAVETATQQVEKYVGVSDGSNASGAKAESEDTETVGKTVGKTVDSVMTWWNGDK